MSGLAGIVGKGEHLLLKQDKAVTLVAGLTKSDKLTEQSSEGLWV